MKNRSIRQRSAWQDSVLRGYNRDRSANLTPQVVERAREALSHKLRDSQRKALELRVAYPDLTLTDLAPLHDPPLTKAALWSRIRNGLRRAEGPRHCDRCSARIQMNRERCTCKAVTA